MGPVQTLDELRCFLIRRAGLILLVALLVTVAGVIFALGIDRAYRAVAVIQVQNPVIRTGDSGDTDTVTRRIQDIQQRLMARDNLLALGERYGMFDDLPLSPVERHDMMRRSVSIEAIAGAQAGFTRDGSVSALIVGASAPTPEIAAALANDLAEEIVRENATARMARAESALRFYLAEEARVDALITETEAEIAAFQARNEEYMPGTLSLRREEMGRLTETRLEIEREIAAARSELAGIDTSGRTVTQRRITQLTEQIARRTDEVETLARRIDAIQAMFQRGAELDLELAAMNRRMTQLQTQLTTVVERRREAEIGARLEGDDQSERFELLEAALPPDHPISRSRKSVVAAAGVAGLMLGLLLAYLVEWLNPVLRTAAMFEREVQLRPVVTLPYLLPDRERRRRQMIWAIGIGFLILAMAALAAALGIL